MKIIAHAASILAVTFVAVMFAALLSSCAQIQPTPPTSVHQPMSTRPVTAPVTHAANGAIWQPGQESSLLEDRRARRAGDIITVNLVERTSAQKNANSSTNRASSAGGEIKAASKVPLSGLAGLSLEAGSKSAFEGKGASAANNAFSGTITVTVIDVLTNGNLLVSGEKMLTINQGNEFIRFSGVVNPNNVSASNTVQSTQVADARIEYRGSGFVEEANSKGWLQRFFDLINPF